jgi:hypothetical protein
LWADAGVTAIDTSMAGVIVKVAVFEVTMDVLAVIKVVPSEIEVANPVVLIVATAGFEECHVVAVVTFFVDKSENVPMAIYC